MFYIQIRFFLFLFLLLASPSLLSQNTQLVFEVDMSHQIRQGKFNPVTEFVDLAGSFNEWGGILTKLTDEDKDSIFSVTIPDLPLGQKISYKFRINGSWNGLEEFPGLGNNRSYQLQAKIDTVFHWYNDEIPSKNKITSFDGDIANIPWWNKIVFYEIFVRSFYDSNGDGIGDFKGLIKKLDYLNDGDPNTNTDLGIGGIWLMPIHPSPSYHGYDVKDYRSINPDYGSMEDFQTFLDEAHKRGMKVIIDFVLNHTSTEHPWFKQSRNSVNSPFRNFYRWNPWDPGYNGPWGQRVWHHNSGGYYYGVFDGGMPDLDYSYPPVRDSIFSIADFWLDDIGVDGLRLDAVKYIYEEGQEMEGTKATFDFFKEFRKMYKSSDQKAFAVGEAWTNTDKVVKYVEGERLDYCFEFDLSYQIINTARSGNTSGLKAQIQKAYKLYPHLQFGTFLTNHDQNRIMDELGNDEEKLKVAAAIYLSLPGIPYVYYGEEIGMNGAKPDEDIRRPMQWNRAPNGGFSSAQPWRALNDNFRIYNVESENSDPNSILNWYRKLIHLRNTELPLQIGTYEEVLSSESPILAFLRQHKGETLLVLINTGASRHQNITLDFTQNVLSSGTYKWTELIEDKSSEITISEDYKLSGIGLKAHEVKIFKFGKSVF